MGNIIFEKIRFKNFMSYGNTFTELPLNNNEMSLITGTNGAGKSSMIDAINYGLFGKPYRKVKLGTLVNRYTKKKMVVEIEFISNQKSWKIIRGIAPAVFEIYENDVLVHQQNTNEYQAWLETNVLGFDEIIFRQIITIGSGYFVPFLKLSLQQRREIIEHLFDLGIFSVMKDINKEKIKKCNDNLSVSLTHTGTLKTQLDAYNDELGRAKKYNEEQAEKCRRWKDENTQNITGQEAFVEVKNKELVSVKKALSNIKIDDSDWERVQREMAETRASLKLLNSEKDNKIASLKLKYKEVENYNIEVIEKTKQMEQLLTSNLCPTCGYVIDRDVTEMLKEKLQNEIDIASGKRDELKSSNQVVFEGINAKYNEDMQQYRDKIAEHITFNNMYFTQKKEKEVLTKTMQEIEREVFFALEKIKTNTLNLSNMTSMFSTVDLEQISDKIIESETLLQEKTKETNKMVLILSYLKELDGLLADTGVRTLVIKRYLTIINKKLNEFLALLGAEYQINFNEEFESAIILRMNEEIDYDNFSGGEKLRIDLAIMLTFQSFIKMKATTNTNLLFMDEILDSSLDNNGMIALTEVLKMFLKNGFTVYVISHREENKNLDAFGCIYNVSQPGKFSILEKK